MDISSVMHDHVNRVSKRRRAIAEVLLDVPWTVVRAVCITICSVARRVFGKGVAGLNSFASTFMLVD